MALPAQNAKRNPPTFLETQGVIESTLNGGVETTARIAFSATVLRIPHLGQKLGRGKAKALPHCLHHGFISATRPRAFLFVQFTHEGAPATYPPQAV
jgi:hypothetical protein